MKFTQEKALMHLTGKSSIDDLNMESIEKLVREYPFFSPGQYFFSAKLRKQGHPLAMAQAIKTALFFSNPYWMKFQLDAINEIHIDEYLSEDTSEPHLKSIEQEKESISTENYRQPADNATEADSPKHLEDPIASTSINETIIEKIVEPTENNEPTSYQNKSDAKIASVLSAQLAEFKKNIDQEAQLEIETQQKKLHTIDYFASQGIQLDLSKIPQDKLTTKLRTFTDWLKDMKNLHPIPKDLVMSPELEKKIAETALISNESKEILTETMAEVLVKQGQIENAIQLYIKLSFSNTEKSAYFAAKIQQLKGI